ncbi:MAG: D-aminoacyl-tRNA deacylase [Spirochaetota bacterium]
MRAVIQRVRAASVVVDGAITGAIDRGLLVYVGVEEGDGRDDLEFVARRIAGLRIFEDAEGKMNLALAQLERRADERIGILAVSQFTLHGDLRKGRRPSYNRAAAPREANRLYEAIVELWRHEGIVVETGVFGAHMDVTYTNDGPVTLLLDSRI